MHFLIDNNISPKLTTLIKQLGYQSTHVSQIKMSKATDEEIFQYAKKNEMIIISADTDFGYILSKWNYNKPSIILFRYISLKAELLIEYIYKIGKDFSEELRSGHIIVVQPDKIRIRGFHFISKNLLHNLYTCCPHN